MSNLQDVPSMDIGTEEFLKSICFMEQLSEICRIVSENERVVISGELSVEALKRMEEEAKLVYDWIKIAIFNIEHALKGKGEMNGKKNEQELIEVAESIFSRRSMAIAYHYLCGGIKLPQSIEAMMSQMNEDR